MLACCASIVACEEQVIPQETVLSTTDFNLPSEGGSVELKFTPNTSWKAACDADFITFDPKSGGASEEIVMNITVAANNGDDRTAKLTLSFETNEVVVTINPLGKSAEVVTIEKTEYSVPAEGGNVVVDFIPTSDWTVACIQDWVKIAQSSGSASDTSP